MFSVNVRTNEIHPPIQLSFNLVFSQKSQPSPGGQSSCSSERSPLGSANNNDSGVEMNLNAAGSLEDLTALEDGVAGGGGGGEVGNAGGTMGMSAQALKRLENLKIDKLKQIRRPTPPGRCASNKLPAIPGETNSCCLFNNLCGKFVPFECCLNSHHFVFFFF